MGKQNCVIVLQTDRTVLCVLQVECRNRLAGIGTVVLLPHSRVAVRVQRNGPKFIFRLLMSVSQSQQMLRTVQFQVLVLY